MHSARPSWGARAARTTTSRRRRSAGRHGGRPTRGHRNGSRRERKRRQAIRVTKRPLDQIPTTIEAAFTDPRTEAGMGDVVVTLARAPASAGRAEGCVRARSVLGSQGRTRMLEGWVMQIHAEAKATASVGSVEPVLRRPLRRRSRPAPTTLPRRPHRRRLPPARRPRPRLPPRGAHDAPKAKLQPSRSSRVRGKCRQRLQFRRVQVLSPRMLVGRRVRRDAGCEVHSEICASRRAKSLTLT